MVGDDDIERIRASYFPVTRHRVHLNHGSWGPLSQPALEAAIRTAESMSRGDVGDIVETTSAACDRTRRLAGQLLGCAAEDIALLKGTSEGLNLVALGVQWRAGDEVICYQRSHPNVVYPYSNLADHGVSVRYVADRQGGFSASDVSALITDRTRVVAIELVSYELGFHAPVEEIGRLCEKHGIWFVVDAIHAVGVRQVDAPRLRADILVAHAYKYLLAGMGVAVTYCSRRAREELSVPVPGHLGRRDPAGGFDGPRPYAIDLTSDARRFESSLPNLGTIEGLSANLELFLKLGPPWIEERAVALAEELRAGLLARGYGVQAPPGPRTSIATATVPAIDIAAISAGLARGNVVCSGSIADGLLRVTPHFYNTTDDVRRLLACLPDRSSSTNSA